MGLYHKQLNSVAELRQERKRLRKAYKKAASQAAPETKTEDNPLSGIAGGLLSSASAKEALISIGMPLFQAALRKAGSGALKKVAKEVLGGYVKWKAIDYGVTLAMRFIRMQQHKAEKKGD